MRKLVLAAVLTALTLVSSSEAIAQDESDPPIQEVFQSELVYPQEKGVFQLTSTAAFRKRKEVSSVISIEYGLTQVWQVGLEWESFSRKTSEDGLVLRGSGDLRVGTKYSFLNIGGSNFHSAVGFELGLPTGSAKKGVSSGQIEYEPYVVVAKDFPKLSRLQVFSQIGITFARAARAVASNDNDDERSFEWKAGMFVPYRKARFTFEINGSSGTDKSLQLTPGIIWKFPHNIEFGVATPLERSPVSGNSGMIVKIVYEFGGTGHRRND